MIKFRKFPSYGDLMTREDFVECVEVGGFIDYDGHGYLSTDKEESSIRIVPSEVSGYIWPEWATHVNWYNR